MRIGDVCFWLINNRAGQDPNTADPFSLLIHFANEHFLLAIEYYFSF